MRAKACWEECVPIPDKQVPSLNGNRPQLWKWDSLPEVADIDLRKETDPRNQTWAYSCLKFELQTPLIRLVVHALEQHVRSKATKRNVNSRIFAKISTRRHLLRLYKPRSLCLFDYFSLRRALLRHSIQVSCHARLRIFGV